MAKKRRNSRKRTEEFSAILDKFLPKGSKKQIVGVIFFILAAIFILSFFEKSGIAGRLIFRTLSFLIGKVVFILPFILLLASVATFITKYKKVLGPLILTISLFIFGASGILEVFKPGIKYGGWLGSVLGWLLLKTFGFWVTNIIFWGLILIGGLILWHTLKRPASEKPSFDEDVEEEEKKPSLIKRIFTPSFKVKEIEPHSSVIAEEDKEDKKAVSEKKGGYIRDIIRGKKGYRLPPINLLELVKERPSAGDIRANSTIIKKTLESFEIPVEMSGINIGPTVTQYSIKPADGIKLSKITSLSNDLALALASHPIRIEAPIPGKSLVGIEVPNKKRAFVALGELIKDSQFQNSSNLTFCLGRDVSGSPVYADLAKMPHLLVAGSTGSGKTIFLNSLITSLLYKNPPDILKFILIDPKRVEFTVYNGLPHLLCPTIVDAERANNALKWLVKEMERRFKLLAQAKSRSILRYNEQASREGTENLPYIILVIDELADLMAAKGRDVESTIVRLAQMARAVGIHLIVATQRPSVEVITGLIKANITSRVTFQVASQVDSRTVLDIAGAEKLLGSGDMLFLSAEVTKPRRLQGAYISEKEVKKVTNWMRSNSQDLLDEAEESIIQESLKESLAGGLENALEVKESGVDDDPLYEEAKSTVIEYRRASASLLQRRLRIGYARAARLVDMLEERGLVGPARGAKPREVYSGGEEDEGWKQV
ncbi:MAG: DNA translocase FtsK [Patescibacteria group bacterium]|nr:DNA translocase FtsK [Patescibacteria group bacterium]